jgi:hypothetical protein
MLSHGKPTRNADLRHTQSIGRQRKAAQRAAADVSLDALADAHSSGLSDTAVTLSRSS